MREQLRTTTPRRKVIVVPHNPNWKQQYTIEARRLTGVLGPEVVETYHIGSTAIPGILAKPIIDIMIAVWNIARIDQYNDALAKLGYDAKGEKGIPGRRFFARGNPALRSHHVHIFQTGHPDIERHLIFRDYLIAHPEEAHAYAHLKDQLAQRFPEDRESYTNGKGDFINEMNRRARAWHEQQTLPALITH
jgi:GrpB-like predicted nucleotidyltransferase (UPF0157 family)